jgi:UDPglucose 6-dehydrogenase
MGLDRRIGNRFLSAGIGYGGSCFPKDVAAFRYVAEQLSVDFGILTEVEKINQQQKRRFFNKVRSALWTFRGKRVAVLGLAFKGGTDDVRESPAFDIIRMLLEEGCTVVAYDPAASERAMLELPAGPSMRYVDDPYLAAREADALLVLSDWPAFAELDLDRLHSCLRYPIVVDGRNVFDPREMLERGFTYLSVGRPAMYPARETAGARRLP